MNEMTIFKNPEFGEIRTLRGESGEPLFCAKDVAKALGYKLERKAVKDHIDKDDVLKRNLTDSLGRTQQTIFINESGLYSLILSSKLESAKKFKRWVTSEVLPAIRKQGGYMVVGKDESDDVVMARALLIMNETLKRRDEQIASLLPKARYADEVLNSVSCMTTTQVAKEMNMTAQELNNLLCRMNIQYKQSGQYMLYAPYARMGLASNRSHVYYDLFGAVYTKPYMVWTEQGRRYIHDLVNNNFNSFLS